MLSCISPPLKCGRRGRYRTSDLRPSIDVHVEHRLLVPFSISSSLIRVGGSLLPRKVLRCAYTVGRQYPAKNFTGSSSFFLSFFFFPLVMTKPAKTQLWRRRPLQVAAIQRRWKPVASSRPEMGVTVRLGFASRSLGSRASSSEWVIGRADWITFFSSSPRCAPWRKEGLRRSLTQRASMSGCWWWQLLRLFVLRK